MTRLKDTIEAPPIASIGDYSFPSRSAQELYGDDQLVNVWQMDNPWSVAAGCFRAPRAMSWADFWGGMCVPYHEEDPDFDAAAGWETYAWQLDGQPWEPRDDATLEELGVTHKSVIGFRAR